MIKEKYYKAILELQKTKSINSISVRDIATQLEITTGSIYYHFSGKNDLLNQMFCFYEHNLELFIEKHQDEELALFLKSYIDYGIKHNEQFCFINQSEIADFLTSESIAYSYQVHLKLIDKMQIKKEQVHKKVIVLGAIRSLLTAPDYYEACNQELLIKELINVINSK